MSPDTGHRLISNGVPGLTFADGPRRRSDAHVTLFDRNGFEARVFDAGREAGIEPLAPSYGPLSGVPMQPVDSQTTEPVPTRMAAVARDSSPAPHSTPDRAINRPSNAPSTRSSIWPR
jgi:hypothetical protein